MLQSYSRFENSNLIVTRFFIIYILTSATATTKSIKSASTSATGLPSTISPALKSIQRGLLVAKAATHFNYKPYGHNRKPLGAYNTKLRARKYIVIYLRTRNFISQSTPPTQPWPKVLDAGPKFTLCSKSSRLIPHKTRPATNILTLVKYRCDAKLELIFLRLHEIFLDR